MDESNLLENELISRAEAAKYLKVSLRSLGRYSTDPPGNMERIPYAKIGSRVLYRLNDLRRWVSNHLILDEPQPCESDIVFESPIGVVYRSATGVIIRLPVKQWHVAATVDDLYPESIEFESEEFITTYVPTAKLRDVISILQAHEPKAERLNKMNELSNE